MGRLHGPPQRRCGVGNLDTNTVRHRSDHRSSHIWVVKVDDTGDSTRVRVRSGDGAPPPGPEEGHETGEVVPAWSSGVVKTPSLPS